MRRGKGVTLYIQLFLGLLLLGINVAPTVCLAETVVGSEETGSEEILAEKVAGSEIAVGDKIVIVSQSAEKAMSRYGSAYYGPNTADVTLRITSTREVITELDEEAAILEVVDM